MSHTTIFCRAILVSVGQGDSHYGWGNQLLLPHYAIFMKHLANGLEVNISFTDKTETYTQNRTSKRIALSTSFCKKHALGCFNVTNPHMLMGLINEDSFLTHVKCVLGGAGFTLYVR